MPTPEKTTVERGPDHVPPYPGWAPYCLMCSTMERMKPTSYGWRCVACRNPIGRDLAHWHGTP